MTQLPPTSRLYVLHERAKMLADDMERLVSNSPGVYVSLWRVTQLSERARKLEQEIGEMGRGEA